MAGHAEQQGRRRQSYDKDAMRPERIKDHEPFLPRAETCAAYSPLSWAAWQNLSKVIVESSANESVIRIHLRSIQPWAVDYRAFIAISHFTGKIPIDEALDGWVAVCKAGF
jgi:hypothetical protein